MNPIRPQASPFLSDKGLQLGFLIYGVLVVILALFHISNGDEGVYLYQSMLLMDGQWPGFDFWTVHPFWLYGIYGGLFKLLGPQMETARLFAAVSSIAVPVMMTIILRRLYGLRLATLGFLVLATNLLWLKTNIVATHYAISNLAMFGAFFLLVSKPSMSFMRALAIGVSLGIMVGTRLPLGLTIPAFIWWMWQGGLGGGQNTTSRAANLKYIVALGIGGFVMTAPDLIYFYQDPDRFIFTRLFINKELDAGFVGEREGLSFVGYFIYQRLVGYLNFFTNSVFWSGPQNLFFVIPLLVWPATATLQRWRNGPRPAAPFLDETGKMAFVIFAAVLIAYSIPLEVGAGHLSQAIPFILICLISGFWHFRQTETAGRSYSRFMLIVAIIALVPYSGSYLVHGAWQILFRNAGGMTQMGTNAQLGCWLEKNISPEDTIMSFYGGPAVNSGQIMPKGFEHAGHGGYWYQHADAKLEEIGSMTPSQFLNKVASGDVAVIIDDSIRENAIRLDHNKLAEILASDYVFHGSLGGQAFPFKIYLNKSWLSKAAGITPLPIETPPTASASLFREKGTEVFIKAAIGDVSSSLLHLPVDLAGALTRAMGASFRARCQSLLNGSPS